MNLRKSLYFAWARFRGRSLPRHYERFSREDERGIPPDTTKKLLIQMLAHCEQSVPYYSEVISGIGNSFYEDPEQYLRRFPILTKEIIRNRFSDLKSVDLPRRAWFVNTSGGSTGEPVRFVQDSEYTHRMGAIKMLYSKWAGREIGEPEVRLWGSERDIMGMGIGWKGKLDTRLRNTTLLNAFRMTPARMRRFIATLNTLRPKLIVAYAQAIYELARFAEREGLEVVPQAAITTSAGTLYPFMREKIQKVFQCKVFNRYGSREVGDIACERPGYDGLWIAPWGNYVEIVNNEGNPVPDGTEGNILVTSLCNFAMPLIRYQIGDMAVLAHNDKSSCGRGMPLIEQVIGRQMEVFKTRDGGIIPGEFFIHFIGVVYNKNIVSKFQVIQKDYDKVIIKAVVRDSQGLMTYQNDINNSIKTVMGNSCMVLWESVKDIPPAKSGKYFYAISEIK